MVRLSSFIATLSSLQERDIMLIFKMLIYKSQQKYGGAELAMVTKQENIAEIIRLQSNFSCLVADLEHY